MRLTRTWNTLLQSGLAWAAVIAMHAGSPAVAAGAITWTDRGLDFDGPILRAVGTDADGEPARLVAVRSTTGDSDESTFVFVQDGRPLLVERLASAGSVWLGVRCGRERLVLERIDDPIRGGSTLRYTFPDGGVQVFEIGARGEIDGDRRALQQRFDRHPALLERIAAFVAALGDPALPASFAADALGAASHPSARVAGTISSFSRCVDECALDCGAQCAAECNLGILDPAGILCSIFKTACLAGCTAGCRPMRSRE